MKRNVDKRTVQPVMPRKNFNRQPNFIGAQMRNVPYRLENSQHHHLRRQPFDMHHQRSLLGRIPSVMDSVHPMYDRVCLSNGDNFQPFMHGGNQQYLLEQERNSGNRCFINPHYKGSVAVAGPGPNRMIPTTELGPCFVNPAKVAPPPRSMFHQGGPPPPQRLNLHPSRNMPPPPNMRFPPPVNVLPGPAGPSGPSGPSRVNMTHNKRNPPQLMDMILRAPFPFQEPPPRLLHQRFRFNSQAPPPLPSVVAPPPRFIAPPLPMVTTKRPLPLPVEKITVAVPYKQPRSVTICGAGYRGFPPPARHETPNSAPRIPPSSNVRLTCPPQRLPSNNVFSPAASASSSFSSSSSSKNTSFVTPMVTPPVQHKTVTQTPAVATKNVVEDEDVTPEMKEYLAKVEEQTRKRNQVIRMKEERRRLKLAAESKTNAESCSVAGSQSNPGVSSIPVQLNNFTSAQNNSESQLKYGFASSNQSHPATAGNAALQTTRKTLLVKPTPTVSNVPPTFGGTSRFRTIIVKDKSGKIVEKRRVAVDEPSSSTPTDSEWNPGCQGVLHNPALNNLTPVHVSKTVTIENLNTNSTEDDVRNLCQMFGSVQEVFPKLQEGKAVVRFKTVNGANNFLCNHNTPGISVTSE